MVLWFALQAPRKLYEAYVHVNAVVEVAAATTASSQIGVAANSDRSKTYASTAR